MLQLRKGEIIKENIFAPITKRLENIHYDLKEDKRKKNHEKIKTESEIVKGEENYEDQDISLDDDYLSFPPKHEDLAHSTPIKHDDYPVSDLKMSILKNIKDDAIHKNKSRFDDLKEESFVDYLSQYDPLPRKYIRGIHENEVGFDKIYGIRMDVDSEKFHIGDSEVKIKGSDIVVQNKRYKGTPGLHELLFKKTPRNFTTDDEKTYQKIVKKTNAHRRYYKYNQQIKGNRSNKYKNIIAPLAKGEGMIMQTVTGKPVDYVHWDDPNELVERLNLLKASERAGHTGHSNEINSIVEELKEANIIR